MTSTTRWVEYEISEAGRAGDGDGSQCKGTRAYSKATSAVSDSFQIGSSNNKLHVNINGDGATYITLASGTALDPRLVARDITEKLHALPGKDDGWHQAQCVWENNQFKLYSGTLGSSSAATVVSGADTAHLELGWGVEDTGGGAASGNTADAVVTISGTYNGFFDEIYKIVINNQNTIGTITPGGSNQYQGTMTARGVFNNDVDVTYTLSVDADSGKTTMGAGHGNCPILAWDADVSDSDGSVELLYPNYWYYIGTKGLMAKFTDRVFNTCDPAWTVVCEKPEFVTAGGGNTHAPIGGVTPAKYIWDSNRGDCSDAAVSTVTGTFTTLGDRGLSIKFTGSTDLYAGDEFYVICTPPQPKSYGITNLDYGNVTVSTESPIKCVIFEITEGAKMMSTVKFGLQSHGTFQHHGNDPSDTKFRFGTVGPGAVPADLTAKEWRANVTTTDINDDTPPSYLHATRGNLSVVSDADNSETIGASHYAGMVADPIFLCIKLGASEVGACSTINFRLYFDYS